MAAKFRQRVPLLMGSTAAALLLYGCVAKRAPSHSVQNLPSEQQVSPRDSSLRWTAVHTPDLAGDITAVGKGFWICGANEMVASSNNGGNTWRVRHQKAEGAVLTHIAFVNQRIGFAAGTAGSILATVDGGKTWTARKADDDFQSFSFANANDGIALLGGEDDYSPHLDSIAKITHDGGKSWTGIPALTSDELRPYSEALSVAALDRSHFLMIRRQPNIEDVFVVTKDAGRTWKIVHPRNDETNREFPLRAVVHNGEYWVFGWELVNRQSRGGYGVGMTLRSADGETWLHSKSGPERASSNCTSQGCRLWDGAIASVFEVTPKYWNVPQDFTLTWNWAMAADRICTINTVTECGPAEPVDKPQPAVFHNTSQAFDKIPMKVEHRPFAGDCLNCGVERIMLDPGMDWQGTVIANFDVDHDGSVVSLFLDGKVEDRLRSQIENQVQRWMFKVSPGNKRHKKIAVDVHCVDLPGALGVDGCRLFPAKEGLPQSATAN